jgi:hypothetical protein
MSPAEVTSTDHWMLRSKKGQEYGPVSFDMLRAWAAQNRFTAGYEISNNRKDWRTVETVPELGMDWFVEPGDGSRYGPFHPLALLDYVREGAVPPETRVIHKVNGGKAKAYQVLLEAFVDAIDQTAEVQGELVRQVQALQERLEERDRWFAEENRQLQEERAKRQELEIASRGLQEQGVLMAGLQARLAQLETDLGQARKEADTERRLRLEAVPRLEEALRAERAKADERIRDALKTGEAALQQELRQVREAGQRQRQEWESQLKLAESRGAEAAGAASRAEAELAVLKARQERERQARETEKAESEVRAVSEIRGEAEGLKASLAARDTELASLRLLLEKERQAREELRAETGARAASEAQQREAADALSREVATQRRENATLRDRLDSVRVEVEEAARTDRELVSLRQASAATKLRLAETEAQAAGMKTEREALAARAAVLEGEREQAIRENEAAARELEAERGRIRTLEARLAERPDEKPREERDGPRRRPAAENGTRPAWASGPVEEVPASGPAAEPRAEPEPLRMPPPRKPGSLAGLEAQAQAELRAWQDKKQAPPKAEPAPKSKSWIPWKKS